MTSGAASIRSIEQPEKVNPAPLTKTNGGNKSGFKFWGDDGFTFGDLIDLLNPLQHIPVVSTVYRAITGDTIAAGPRLLGGALLGAPFGGALIGTGLGFATAAANTLIERKTGKDVGQHLLALLHTPKNLEGPPIVVAAKAHIPPPAFSEVPPALKDDQKASLHSTPTPPNWTSHVVAAALDKYAQNLRLLASAGTRINAPGRIQ